MEEEWSRPPSRQREGAPDGRPGGEEAVEVALRRWAEEHKAKVRGWEEESRQEEGLLSWLDTEEQRESRRMNRLRAEIASETAAEVDHAVRFLLRSERGPTSEDVDRLIARKERELEMELEYNLNFTNRKHVRESDAWFWKKGGTISWSEDELIGVESLLVQLPREHVTQNQRLREIQRSDAKWNLRARLRWPFLEWDDDIMEGGRYLDGRVRVHDWGVKGHLHITREERELADATSCARCDQPITPLEEVLAHEIGHSLHEGNPETFEAFQAAATWETGLGARDLKARGLTGDDIASLKEGEPVIFEGRVYRADRYDRGSFSAYEEGAIPTSSSWSFARIDYREHFAEFYARAILTPETLHEELITAPQRRVEKLEEVLTGWTDGPPALGFQQVRKELEAARRIRDSRRRQYRVMRRELFGAPALVAAAVERLRERGLPRARIEAFEAAAERAHTPRHIEFLERRLVPPPVR